jgi:HTH-type transcriptional regulator/antitoxin HigA
MKTNIYQSDLAIHSGEFLEETIEEIGITKNELSNRLGEPLEFINDIIEGKRGITPTLAFKLEDVLGVPYNIWIGLETEYQIVTAKQKELEEMKEESKFVNKFPYEDLIKFGFVKATNKAIEKVEELKKFFNVAKLSQISQIKTYQPAFRVSKEEKISQEALATWIQVVRIKAKEIKTKPFNKKKLEEFLTKLKSTMNLDNINESIKEIKTILNDCGVAFVLLPEFKNTKVHGVTFWMDNNQKAVISMSLRGGYSDIFWFSFFHEIGHILLHPKREVFFEDGYNNSKLKIQEEEADKFAKNLLINEKDYQEFIQSKDFILVDDIYLFAKKQGVKTSIIAGRLIYDKIVKHDNKYLFILRDRYEWSENNGNNSK